MTSCAGRPYGESHCGATGRKIWKSRECQLGELTWRKMAFQSCPYERMKPGHVFYQTQNVLFYVKQSFVQNVLECLDWCLDIRKC